MLTAVGRGLHVAQFLPRVLWYDLPAEVFTQDTSLFSLENQMQVFHQKFEPHFQEAVFIVTQPVVLNNHHLLSRSVDKHSKQVFFH